MNIVHTEASCGWGGQEIRILNEARGMIARGHQVQLLCPAEARIYAEAPRFGVPVTALPIARKKFKGLFALRAWLKNNQIDVLNTHSSTDTWLAALACATMGDSPPLVRTRHISAPVPNNLSTRWLYRKASARIVTTGESLRQSLITHNGLDPARVVSIPTGIDTTHYRPPTETERASARLALNFSDGQFIIGIVATLRSWKGHRYLVEALGPCLIKQPQIKLVIVGDGPQRAALEQQVSEMGLNHAVQFAGNQSDVVPWLHALDLFVLPSYANEGVPQALLQAMACALPVITTGAGAIGEIAHPDKTALVVAKESSTALTDAVLRLHADAALRERLARDACALVRERHGLTVMLERMEHIFRQVFVEMN